jgi:hypothetical protein
VEPARKSVGFFDGPACAQVDEKLSFFTILVDRVNLAAPAFGFKAANSVPAVNHFGQEGLDGQIIVACLRHAGPANAFRTGDAGGSDDCSETGENDDFTHDFPFP